MTQPLGFTELDFRRDGNASPYLREGWSWQEPAGTWAIGPASALLLPAGEHSGVHHIRLHVVPFIAKPSITKQRITILLNGVQLVYSELSTADATSIIECEAPNGVVRTGERNTLTIVHPDGAIPKEHISSSEDKRQLSIRMLSLKIASGHASEVKPERITRRVAIITTAYNEKINLPLWIRYYSSSAPDASLFVIDHGTDDGSTSNLSGISRIPIPRTDYDDPTRAFFVNQLQHAFLKYYDIVIYVDSDEIICPDPDEYLDLSDYLQRFRGQHVSPVGLNVLHACESESPINLARSILSQRHYCRFSSSMCKPAITMIPLVWEVGFHSCNRKPNIDTRLFLFHLKTMDRGLGLERQRFMRNVNWSAGTLAANFGAHQRASDHDFLEAFYDGPSRVIGERQYQEFNFSNDVERFYRSIQQSGEIHRPGHFVGTIAKIPEKFSGYF